MNAPLNLIVWPEVFDRLRPQIQKALDLAENAYTFDALKRAVESGRLKCFYRHDAVLICEMQIFPQLKVLVFLVAAGKLDSVFKLEERAREWGKAYGCTKVWLCGRPGWEKWGKRRGWRKANWINLIKDLNDG